MRTITITTLNALVSLTLYAASIILYLQPITNIHQYEQTHNHSLIHSPTPVLDEIYLLPDGDNNDVKIDPHQRTPLQQVFQNDYWGRNMNSPSSHKSYRPFTVLSLRLGYFIANVLRMNGLFVQRVLNVILHAVLVQMVGRLYQCLFPIASADANTKNAFLLKAHTLASILFMLHPTHIESVVNVANRAHLLSLLLVMLSLDLSLHAILGGMIYTMGLLACETTIFLFPAICLTWIYMDYTASDHDADNGNDNGNGSDGSNHWKILHFIRKRLWRIVLFSVITFVYISMRYYFDWIVIPQGLIRPAENPFYALGGMDRVLNYSYVMSIHVVKSIGMGFVDLVGFSHEYGFDCVKRIDSLYDGRLLYPLILGALIFWLIQAR